MTSSVVAGALLANEVGTGKTFTMVFERLHALRDRRKRLEELGISERDDATEHGLLKTMPTAIWAPASVIEQHFNEISRLDQNGDLILRTFHGSQSNTSHNSALQASVMGVTELNAEMRVAVEHANSSLVS